MTVSLFIAAKETPALDQSLDEKKPMMLSLSVIVAVAVVVAVVVAAVAVAVAVYCLCRKCKYYSTIQQGKNKLDFMTTAVEIIK